MLRILIAIAALLIYGSLYPWQFHQARQPGGPLHALLNSWEFSLSRYALRDVALNIAIYLPFGAAAYLWLSARPRLVRLAGPLLLAACLSVSIELAQFYDARRFTSLVDVTSNVLGAALGMALATGVARRQRAAAPIRIPQPGALLLLCCWLLSLLFPLIPDLSRTNLNGKLAQFYTAGFVLPVWLSLLTLWLVAGRLLQKVADAEGGALLFPLLGLVLPARFLILGLNADLPYWATFLVAWAVAALLSKPGAVWDAVLAGFILLSTLAVGLTPFHFTAEPRYFEWIPLRALFSTQWETGFTVFLRKAFLYGSAIWLLREAGLRLRYAALSAAAVLAAVEAAQIFESSGNQAGHAAEITDPLLALLLAWVLHRLARAAQADVTQSSHDGRGNSTAGFERRVRAGRPAD